MSVWLDKSNIPKFSDFAQEDVLTGEKIKIEHVIGKEIIVTAYELTRSKYSKGNSETCLKLQFLMEDKEYILFSASNVLTTQIEKYKDNIPFSTVIQSIDKYYSFT